MPANSPEGLIPDASILVCASFRPVSAEARLGSGGECGRGGGGRTLPLRRLRHSRMPEGPGPCGGGWIPAAFKARAQGHAAFSAAPNGPNAQNDPLQSFEFPHR